MKSRLMYIEKCTDGNHDGPAWIGRVRFSRTGETAYFNNKALGKGNMLSGNHFDRETGEEYWISGVKKNGQDRHRLGKGFVFGESAVLEEYLAFRGIDKLEPRKYEVVEIVETKTPADFYHLNNAVLRER